MAAPRLDSPTLAGRHHSAWSRCSSSARPWSSRACSAWARALAARSGWSRRSCSSAACSCKLIARACAASSRRLASSSLTSADRVLAGPLGPTRCLAGFLADATNLLNGLVSQVVKAVPGLVLGLVVPAHGRPTISRQAGRSTCPISSSTAGRSPGDNLLSPSLLCRRGRDGGLACSAEGNAPAWRTARG